MSGFSTPRPDDLPISAAVWDIADGYGKDGAAVVEALYDAVRQLESRLNGDGADELLKRS